MTETEKALTIINDVAKILDVSPENLKAYRLQKYSLEKCACIREIRQRTTLRNWQIAPLFNCNSHCMISYHTALYRDKIGTDRDLRIIARKLKSQL